MITTKFNGTDVRSNNQFRNSRNFHGFGLIRSSFTSLVCKLLWKTFNLYMQIWLKQFFPKKIKVLSFLAIQFRKPAHCVVILRPCCSSKVKLQLQQQYSKGREAGQGQPEAGSFRVRIFGLFGTAWCRPHWASCLAFFNATTNDPIGLFMKKGVF